MNDISSNLNKLKIRIGGGLIVSCQAPSTSPLAKPEIIAALAETAELNGAAAVRIDSPVNISAVRKAVKIPIIGIYKIVQPPSEVYITPHFRAASEVAEAGADIIAVDATSRARPNDEEIGELCERIKNELKLPIMADISTLAEGINAAENLGCSFIGTTLSGYTRETENLLHQPDFDLIANLSQKISVPIISEGRLSTAEHVHKAFSNGAFAVVIGNAITGIDNQIKKYAEVCQQSERIFA